MKVKILRTDDQVEIVGKIEDKGKHILPSFHDGWFFDFNKHSKKIAHAQTYVLVTEEKPLVIEGCLILKVEKGKDYYMAYIEVAPHNRGENKKYSKVAGCLIAFACRLSHTESNGYLSFQVSEKDEQDQKKLMILYSKKYYAQRIGDTNQMIIVPEDGQTLIKEYLNG
jgi:hypothetical protein